MNRTQSLSALTGLLIFTGIARAQSQEVVPPTEARNIAILVDMVGAAVKGTYALGIRPAMRNAHAKAHGCVRATVLDTTGPGSRNTGHWFTDEKDCPGRIGRADGFREI